MAGFFIDQEETCDICDGKGKFYKRDCGECNGEKFFYKKTAINIDLEPGVEDETQIIKLELGDEEPDLKKGDLCIQVHIMKHEIFKRADNDLYMEKNITLFEALCGLGIQIKLLDGKKINVEPKRDQMIKPNSFQKLKGFGMPGKNIFMNKGDLIIKFNMIFPLYIEDYELKNIKIILQKSYANKNVQNRNNKKQNNYNRSAGGEETTSNESKTTGRENDVDYIILERTDKKYEDFIDDDEEEKRKRRNKKFYDGTQFNDENQDEIFNQFKDYAAGFCNNQ